MNAAGNLVFFGLSLIIGLWYTPYVIRHLGVAVYGLAPLANSITNYMGVVTVILAGSVGRFVTADLAKGDRAAANKTFNTFFFGGARLIAGLMILAAVFSWAVPRIFNVPVGEYRASQWLFFSVMGSFLIAAFATCFDVAFWVRSRFDIRSLIDCVTLLVRVGTVIALFNLFPADLTHIAIAVPIAEFVHFTALFLSWRRLTPELRVRRSDFERSRLPALLHTSRWLFLNALGGMVLANVDLILVNILIGPAISGRYATVLQWAVILRMACLTLSSVITPSMVALYARQDVERIINILRQSISLMGALIAIPVGVLCGLARPALHTWLGPEFGDLAPLAWVILMPVVVEATQTTVSGFFLAIDKLRVPALFTLGAGLCTVLLAITLVRGAGMGMFGIAVSSAAILTIRQAFFMPMYAARLLHAPLTSFARLGWRAMVKAFVIGGVAWIVSRFTPGGSWPALIVAGLAVATVTSVLVYAFGLDPENRATLRRMLERGVLNRNA